MRKIVLVAALLIAGPAMAMSLEDAARPHNAPTACIAMGSVYRLDPYGDNNLSVRASPSGAAGLAHEKDELFTGERVCVTHMAGKWAFVIYNRNGRAFSGWVHSRYIWVDGE